MDLINKQAVLEIINSYGGCDATDPCDRHCDTMMGSLYADIESLPASEYPFKKAIKPHWIPVEDQLPLGKADVLICTRKGWILVGWYGPNGECWHITPTGTGYLPPDVVAWMPLPEPYKIADKNEDLSEEE